MLATFNSVTGTVIHCSGFVCTCRFRNRPLLLGIVCVLIASLTESLGWNAAPIIPVSTTSMLFTDTQKTVTALSEARSCASRSTRGFLFHERNVHSLAFRLAATASDHKDSFPLDPRNNDDKQQQQQQKHEESQDQNDLNEDLNLLNRSRPTSFIIHSSSSSPSDGDSDSNYHNGHLNEGNGNWTARVEQKIRVAALQAKIDRIRQDPDAPLDMEHEMKKVTHIAPPIDCAPPSSLADTEVEEKESRLESDLYHAINQQEFGKAANLQRELNQMHMDDCGAVLRVNAAFYRSFSNKNLIEMKALWWKDATSTCIHPSCQPLLGYKAVCESWKRMFEATTGGKSFQRIWMEPKNIRISVKGATTAIISCDELVYMRRFVRGQRRSTELVNKLVATNIFRKMDGCWYMIHHHSSWHPDSENSKIAMRKRQLFSISTNTVNQQRRSGASNRGDDDKDATIGMDGILGMTTQGPLLGGSSQKGQPGKPIKRLIMGSLNDILGGQLGDILGQSSSSGHGQGNGNDIFNSDGATVLRFESVVDDEGDGEVSDDEAGDADDNDDDNDDDELVQLKDGADDLNDEEEEEDESDDDDGNEQSSSLNRQSLSLIKGWTGSKKVQSVSLSSFSDRKDRSKSKTESHRDSTSAPKDVLRQNCIAALRRLCDQGRISSKQKRVLLSDIISCSARGEFSMVEVAFELLCGEAVISGIDSDVAEEEFADQCRMFAVSLNSSPLSTENANDS